MGYPLLAACSDDDDDGDATSTPDVCEQSEAVRQSVEDLASLDVIASGTDGLNAAVDNVRTEVPSSRRRYRTMLSRKLRRWKPRSTMPGRIRKHR